MGQCQTKRQIRRKRKAMGQENTFSANKQFGIRYAMKRKLSERAKSGEMPKAVQRASPLALAFPCCDLPNLSRRVLVWRSEATPLVIDKHTPRCQNINLINCFPNIYPLNGIFDLIIFIPFKHSYLS